MSDSSLGKNGEARETAAQHNLLNCHHPGDKGKRDLIQTPSVITFPFDSISPLSLEARVDPFFGRNFSQLFEERGNHRPL